MATSLQRKLLLYRAAVSLDRASRLVTHSPTLVTAREGARARVDFNRPRFFNCIDDTVIQPLAAFLSSCVRDPSLELLLIGSVNAKQGKGAKGVSFSTGADLIKGWRIIDRKWREGRIEEQDRVYLVNFYRSQYLLHTLTNQTKTLTLMDGITMGSAVLFGLNSSYSLVTERTVWAVPEVSIGSVPDVGSLHHLERKGTIGRVLALTGTKLRGRYVSGLGVSTHYCHSSLLPRLREELSVCPPGEVGELLEQYTHRSGGRGEEEVQDFVRTSEAAYQAGDLQGTLARLGEKDPHLASLTAKACPLSLLVTDRLTEAMAGLTYPQALLLSYKVAGNLYFCPEMALGIEAALLSGGKRKPRWNVETLAKVPGDLVDHCFTHTFKEGTLTMEQLTDPDTTNPY